MLAKKAASEWRTILRPVPYSYGTAPFFSTQLKCGPYHITARAVLRTVLVREQGVDTVRSTIETDKYYGAGTAIGCQSLLATIDLQVHLEVVVWKVAEYDIAVPSVLLEQMLLLVDLGTANEEPKDDGIRLNMRHFVTNLTTSGEHGCSVSQSHAVSHVS